MDTHSVDTIHLNNKGYSIISSVLRKDWSLADFYPQISTILATGAIFQTASYL